MTVGLIMLALAVYAAQHGSYGICGMALLAMLYAFVFVRLPR
jgi:hypothetical protein